MINIHVYSSSILDATGFYRSAGPLSELRHLGLDVRLNFHSDNVNWIHMKMADVVFVQRPWHASAMEVIRLAKEARKPVWVDYDDDLTCVPLDNPSHDEFMKPQTQMVIRNALMEADVVTVSTKTLQAKLQTLTTPEKVRLIPNAWDDYAFPMEEAPAPGKEKRIVWRGSATHQKDLEEIKDQVIETVTALPDYTWVFMGYLPWRFQGIIPRDKFIYYPMQPMERGFAYFETLKLLNAQLGIIPLSDSPFNRAKSDIAWMELTYAGAACLVPAGMAEFNFGHTAGDLSFCGALEFMSRTKALAKSVRSDRNEIQNNRVLSKVNRLRADLLCELLKKGTQPTYYIPKPIADSAMGAIMCAAKAKSKKKGKLKACSTGA